jgi:hypothetical protein
MAEKYEVKLSIKAKDDLKGIIIYIKNYLRRSVYARRKLKYKIRNCS